MIEGCSNWCVTHLWLELRIILFTVKLLKNYGNSLDLFTLEKITCIKSMISPCPYFNQMWTIKLHLRYTLIVIVFFNNGILFYLLLMILMQCILNVSNLKPCVFLCHCPLHLELLISRFCLILNHSLWICVLSCLMCV